MSTPSVGRLLTDWISQEAQAKLPLDRKHLLVHPEEDIIPNMFCVQLPIVSRRKQATSSLQVNRHPYEASAITEEDPGTCTALQQIASHQIAPNQNKPVHMLLNNPLFRLGLLQILVALLLV